MKTGTEKESGSGSGNGSWDGNWDGDGDGIRDETDTETKAEREDGDGNRAGIIISLALKTLPIVSGGSRGGGGCRGRKAGRVGASHSHLGYVSYRIPQNTEKIAIMFSITSVPIYV